MKAVARSELRSCVKVKVAVLDPLSLMVRGTVSGDGDSSVVRAPDSRLKGPGFKSL